ncbi:hypothetical protein Tco_1122952 [Tanacetum coccineum]|uniref:Uncharacterized protein n=1 Tax=Tanacetum coccineum TaxID=301880 RepID=A0ABQ5J1Z2_9ASTR
MSSASSAVTYTSVYIDSEPDRVFWGADEEISDGGIPRVIIYGYDGLPMQPVAPPSPDYIPGPEDLQTPPVPQDEDEREPMFVQAHDPDYVPEPIYPEYTPLEDEHEFPDEEQPLPPVVSPTAESPEYVTESDPKEDPEEYEDDETEDGQVDYPLDGGDDDDGDSSRDDVNDEDEDEEEEKHPTPADSAVVIPTVEPDCPPERTEPIMPPPPTDISTTRARITVRLQAYISLPLMAERGLARCTAPPALSSPPPVPSPLLPSSGCPTQIQTLRIASTQVIIDVVIAALPLPPLPPLPPSMYTPPPVNRRDDLLESELPLRKRLCLSTPGSKYEIRESSTARPTRGRGVDYGFVSIVDAKARWQGISKVGVTKLVELHERNTQDLYALLEDAQDGGYAFLKGLGLNRKLSKATHQELQPTKSCCMLHDDPYPGTSDTATTAGYSHSDTASARQPGPDARIPDHQDASRDADSHI